MTKTPTVLGKNIRKMYLRERRNGLGYRFVKWHLSEKFIRVEDKLHPMLPSCLSLTARCAGGSREQENCIQFRAGAEGQKQSSNTASMNTKGNDTHKRNSLIADCFLGDGILWFPQTIILDFWAYRTFSIFLRFCPTQNLISSTTWIDYRGSFFNTCDNT